LKRKTGWRIIFENETAFKNLRIEDHHHVLKTLKADAGDLRNGTIEKKEFEAEFLVDTEGLMNRLG